MTRPLAGMTSSAVRMTSRRRFTRSASRLRTRTIAPGPLMRSLRCRLSARRWTLSVRREAPAQSTPRSSAAGCCHSRPPCARSGALNSRRSDRRQLRLTDASSARGDARWPDSARCLRYRFIQIGFTSPGGRIMAIGPVQLIVLGFSHPDFHGEIIAELERLRESDTVRVIDALAVYKDADGELEVEHLSNLTESEAIELGSKIGALIGLGIEGEEGMEGGVHVFTEEEGWDVLEDIPNDSAAALILIEHHWAVPLRDAIARAGGFRISDAFISPLDLVELGLVSADEAKQLHELETLGAAS